MYKKEVRKNIIFSILVFFSVLVVFIPMMINAKITGAELIIGPAHIPSGAINGVVQGISFLLLLFILFLDRKRGFSISIIIIGINVAGCIRTLMQGNMTAMAGFVNIIYNFVAIVLIYRQLCVNDSESHLDRVTGLFNSRELISRLEKTPKKEISGYLMHMHIIGIQKANANFGREMGDEILRTVSAMIKKAIKRDGHLYKIEGAELIARIYPQVDKEALVDRINECFEHPILIKSEATKCECFIGVKMGISGELAKYSDFMQAMRDAELALDYASGRSGMNACFMNDEIRALLEENTAIENMIVSALAENRVIAMYQPQFSLKDTSLRGVEALACIKMPDGEIIYPENFLEVAEKTELIKEIDKLIVRRVLEDFRNICLNDRRIKVSVNVFSSNMCTKGYAPSLLGIMSEIGFPTECLEVDIKEVIDDSFNEHINSNVHVFTRNKVSVAMDDFGNHAVRISGLRDFPGEIVKLDKTMLRGITQKDENKEYLYSVINFIHSIGKKAFAVGVETKEQLTMLEQLGCDYAQGYFLARPCEYAEAKNIVKSTYLYANDDLI